MAGINGMTCAAGAAVCISPNRLLVGYPDSPVVLAVGMAVDIVAGSVGWAGVFRNRCKGTVIFTV